MSRTTAAVPAPQRRTTFFDTTVCGMSSGYKPALPKARKAYRKSYDELPPGRFAGIQELRAASDLAARITSSSRAATEPFAMPSRSMS